MNALVAGTRRTFIADGHDVASSRMSERWRTPSGALIEEGKTYEKEWTIKPRLARIDRGVKTYRERGGWEIVSEALDR